MTSPFSSKNNLVTRLLVAGIALPLLSLAVAAGGLVFVTVAALVGVAGAAETMSLLHRSGWRPLRNEGVVWAGLLIGSSVVGGWLTLTTGIVGPILLLALSVIYRRRLEAIGDWVLSIAGALYVAVPLLHIAMLRGYDSGIEWVLIALFATFGTDTGAFIGGRIFGRTKLAPSISPSKTWEGAGFGLAAGILSTLGLIAVMPNVPFLTIWASTLGVLISILAQFGDLAESKLKRMARTKESGFLIPGHGGVLDRLDSLVLVFPLVYYAARIWPSG